MPDRTNGAMLTLMRVGRSLLALGLGVVLLAQTPVARAQAVPALVWFRGRPVIVKPPTTVVRAIEAAGAHPASGRLLDIRGGVIDRNAFSPTYSRNAARAKRDAAVSTGDTVDYSDGEDGTERSVVEAYGVPEGNPASHLGPHMVVMRRGSISQIVVPLRLGDTGTAVALTFDDGPHARFTPAVLDVLNKANVKATFFVVGRQAARHPDLVRREIASGMQVHDHTWDHPHLKGTSPSYQHDQLAKTRDLLRRTGAPTTLFRPPYGNYSAQTVSIAHDLGMRTVTWSVDPRDWSRPSKDAIVRRVLDRVRPGSIILMHDGGGDRRQTVDALTELLRALAARGYRFLTIR